MAFVNRRVRPAVTILVVVSAVLLSCAPAVSANAFAGLRQLVGLNAKAPIQLQSKRDIHRI